MATSEYIPPVLNGNAFHCPACGTFAHQRWFEVLWQPHHSSVLVQWRAGRCERCEQWSLWREKAMIYPSGGNAPLPDPNMPDDIKRDYEEARAILNRSPRGAAALLRLAIQKLCVSLGKPGKNINDDIAALVKDGLNERVRKALDTVRVIGNDAVHPGTIDLRDDPALAGALFRLVNIIVEKMIGEPREIDDLYATLPEGKREEIDRRNAKAEAAKP